MSIQEDAKIYARQHVSGMQPVATIGEKIESAYLAGADRAVARLSPCSLDDLEATWREDDERAWVCHRCGERGWDSGADLDGPDGISHLRDQEAVRIAENDAAARIIVEEVYGPGEPAEWQLDNARAALSRLSM